MNALALLLSRALRFEIRSSRQSSRIDDRSGGRRTLATGSPQSGFTDAGSDGGVDADVAGCASNEDVTERNWRV